MLDAGTREFDLLLRFAGLVYAAIIMFRLSTYIANSYFPNTDTRLIVFAFTLFAVSAVCMSSGGANQYGAVVGLLNATIFISIATIVYGGMATGSLIKNNPVGFLTALLLFGAEVSLVFIEPFLSAFLAIGALLLNMYLEYQDMYGFLYNSFWNNDWARYILVYPPLVLLFTFSDIIFVSELIGQIATAFITIFLTFIGVGVGFLRTTQKGRSYFSQLFGSTSRPRKSPKWNYCARGDDCNCGLPKVCIKSDCNCNRPKYCVLPNCTCSRRKGCTDVNCTCNLPKIYT